MEQHQNSQNQRLQISHTPITTQTHPQHKLFSTTEPPQESNLDSLNEGNIEAW